MTFASQSLAQESLAQESLAQESLAQELAEARQEIEALRGRLAAQQQASQQASHALLAAVLEHTGSAMIATHPDGVIATFNPAAEALLGYTAAEVVGRMTPAAFFAPVELNQRTATFLGPFPLAERTGHAAPAPAPATAPAALPDGLPAAAPAARRFSEAEPWTFVRKDGGLLAVRLRAAEVRAAGGALLGYVGIVDDVTEQKRAEAAIGELVERLELATRAAGIGVWDWDLVQDFVYWDENMLRILGLPPTGAQENHRDWVQFIHVDDRMRVKEEADAARSGVRPYDTTFRIVRPDGEIRYLHAVASVLAGDGGKPLRMVGAGIDITAERQAEVQRRQTEENLRQSEDRLRLANAELKRAGRLKDEFLASMSHELRTPLNAILVIGESLSEGVYGPLTERQVEALRDVVDSGDHLLELINDILDLSKIEAGKMELQLATLEVGALCNASVRMVREQAHQKRQSVILALPDERLWIQADERRLKQLLVNLLSNAVKFTPERGRIGLEVAKDDDACMLYLAVWDTGIGIAPEHMSQLFQPFIQLDSTLSRQHGGTGLGLALVRRLAQLHGGYVTVDSRPGAGSRFVVALPWIAAESEGEGQAEGQADGQSGGALPAQGDARAQNGAAGARGFAGGNPFEFDLVGIRVLIAEDNEMNRVAIVDLLKQLGAEVSEAGDGGEAVAAAVAQRPHLILMDIQMANMDGLEAMRKIRATAGFERTPIVALTALAMPEDRERCLAAGATEFISKPVSLRHLVGRVHELVELAGK